MFFIEIRFFLYQKYKSKKINFEKIKTGLSQFVFFKILLNKYLFISDDSLHIPRCTNLALGVSIDFLLDKYLLCTRETVRYLKYAKQCFISHTPAHVDDTLDLIMRM